MKKSSIVIPAYNEEKRIGNTLNLYSKYFSKLFEKKEHDYDILVVINNTTDNTEHIVKKSIELDGKIRFINIPRGGKGYAVKRGFEECLKNKCDYIGFVDADLATSPNEYYKLILALNQDINCGVIANRYIKNSKIIPSVSLQRLLAKRLFNFFVRSILLIPYTDTQCGAKIFKRRVIEKTLPLLSMSRWAFDVDLIYTIRKNGFKIKSLPTVWVDREYSKINFWSSGPWMFAAIIRLRILNSPFKRFVKIYDIFLKFIPI